MPQQAAGFRRRGSFGHVDALDVADDLYLVGLEQAAGDEDVRQRAPVRVAHRRIELRLGDEPFLDGDPAEQGIFLHEEII